VKRRLRVQQDFASGFEFLLFYAEYSVDQNGTKSISMAEKPDMSTHQSHLIAQPFLSLDDAGAQELLDDLWGCGIRPSERLRDQTSIKHIQEEVVWHREVIDHLIKRTKGVG
jgi:hypothetical protein